MSVLVVLPCIVYCLFSCLASLSPGTPCIKQTLELEPEVKDDITVTENREGCFRDRLLERDSTWQVENACTGARKGSREGFRIYPSWFGGGGRSALWDIGPFEVDHVIGTFYLGSVFCSIEAGYQSLILRRYLRVLCCFTVYLGTNLYPLLEGHGI